MNDIVYIVQIYIPYENTETDSVWTILELAENRVTELNKEVDMDEKIYIDKFKTDLTNGYTE